MITPRTSPRPVILIYLHSGGTDPGTGAPSVASLARLHALHLEQTYLTELCNGRTLLVLGGEQTRKSGPWPQCDKLKEYILTHTRVPAVAIRTYPLSTEQTFAALAEDYLDATQVLFVNDDVHMARYLAKFRLMDRRYARKVHPLPVTASVAYGAKYSVDYVTCYTAAGWLALISAHLNALVHPTTAWQKTVLAKPWLVAGLLKSCLLGVLYSARAITRIGLNQYITFIEDRRLNKDTTDPDQLARIAAIRRELRPDLLGE